MNHVLFSIFPNPLPMLLIIPFCTWLVIRYPRDKRTDAMLLIGMLILPVSYLVIHAIRALTYISPLKYDQFFYIMDLRLGDPSYKLGMFLVHHAFIRGVIANIYNLLPYELVV